MMNLAGTSKLLIAAAGVLALQACATTYPNMDAFLSTSPRLDARFGDAVNIAKAQQTLNPDASKNRNVVAGIDGKAAQETMVRYRESFKSPPPPANVFTIGVSGGGQ
ncbi:MAG TPA: pilus assembly protein [Casimicrobiaceae bacterium]|jgi:hypothetical protein|nr:pilus assembly protein [Casimicrobiaceae bacterium]